MNESSSEFAEVFLQEASEHLQFLRDYFGILQEPGPKPEDVERLYISAHTLTGTSAGYGYPLFAEVAGKLAHVFQYARNAGLGSDVHGSLTEFISDGIALLESDLLLISTHGLESAEDFDAFRQRYAFAFQAVPEGSPAAERPAAPAESSTGESAALELPQSVSFFHRLPPDGDIPGEVLEFFIPEAEEHLQTVSDCLLALEARPNPEDIHRLFRATHTLKGSAAQVGLHRIAAVAHRLEDLIGQLRDGYLQPSAEIVDLCLESVDVLKRFLRREWPSEMVLLATVSSLLSRIAELAPEALSAEGAAETSSDEAAEQGASSLPEPSGRLFGFPVPPAIAVEAAAGPSEAAVASAPGAAKESALPASRSVRISLERLNRMMNAVGELVINRTRMVGRLAELGKLVDILNFSKSRLADKISEFQDKHEFSRIGASLFGPPRDANSPRGATSSSPLSHSSLTDFSELEMDRYDDFNILSRSLTEISADVTEVLSQLNGFRGRVDSDIDEFTKLAHHLQDEITQARMVPIGNLYTRLTRTVRDAAKASGKQVELELEGAGTELDNSIIQQISDPLIHLARNAVAHGIEAPEERLRAGKPAAGRVGVRAYHRGNHIYVEVEDDGGGIDYDAVRSSAAARGLLSPGEAASLSERELRALLFHPGFSTAPLKTELAGRGVGLDVVRTNLNGLNGEIEVETEKGTGTCFTLKVPLTLIISPALFVRCGGAQFAFPLAVVEEIRRLRGHEIEEVGGKSLTRVRDAVIEVVRLDTRLGLEPIEPVNGYYRMVIVQVGGHQAGVIVEEVLGKDEIVIKNLGEYLRSVKLFPGTTIASDGSLILLIDLNRLVNAGAPERLALAPSASAARVFAPGAAAVAAGVIPTEAIDAIQNDKVVVVADDSISVRKFVGRMLEKAGYRVKLASDGLEAVEIVAQTGCHLVITDLEMPRMNGYELMAQLRQSPETRRTPVLVVTSRAGAKHRERAMKEGAAAFLIKPVQEEQLLATIAQLIGAETAPGRPAPVRPFSLG